MQNAHKQPYSLAVHPALLALAFLCFGGSSLPAHAAAASSSSSAASTHTGAPDVQPVYYSQPQVIIKEVQVPGPVRTVIREVPGPVRTIIKEVPGPERIIEREVIKKVPGPVRTIIREVPGPERIVEKEVIREVPAKPKNLPSSGPGLGIFALSTIAGAVAVRRKRIVGPAVA